MRYQLIVPPIYETKTTGFICGGAKEVRKTLWRVDVYHNESKARVYRNGVPVPDGKKLPAIVYELGNAVVRFASLATLMEA